MHADYIYIYILYLSNICNFKICWGMLRQCTMASFPRSPHPPTPPWSCATWNLQARHSPAGNHMLWFGDLISWVSLVEPQRSPIVWGWKLLTTRLAAVHTGEEMIKFAGHVCPKVENGCLQTHHYPQVFPWHSFFWPNSPNVRWPIPRSHSSKPSDNWPSKT